MKQQIKKQTVFGLLFALVFAGLIGLFALGLNNNPNELDLVTKDSQIPDFTLPSLLDNQKTLSKADLTTDKPYYLINFWGSWCPSCYQEHAYLLQLSQQETLYGVNWKDDYTVSRAFIREAGNPFKAIVIDDNSVLAIGMGVYGAPETFLIKADGTILHRYAGPMNAGVWRREFLPKIEKIKNAKALRGK